MISVIIATYGEDSWRELALQRALPSVEAHSASNEIIVGHVPDGTISSVRNALAAKANGDWLCFLDADDELGPNFLSTMHRHIARATGDVLLTPIVQQIINGRRKRPAFYREVNLATGNWLIVGTVLSKDLFERAQGFGEYPHGFEDWSLWSKCHKLGAQVVKVRSAVYIQHVNPKSKHRQGWKDRKWQVNTHLQVQRELEEWTP